MRHRHVIPALLILTLLSFPAPLTASQEARGGEQRADEQLAVPEERVSATEHTIRIDGEAVPYRATAANMLLENDDGEPIGSLYYTAYTRTDVDDPSRRPVAFIYNGGPGSASLWLHMGAFGPRRINVNPTGPTPPPPYDLSENPWSLIDVTDMVFVDPIGTGFSKVVGEGEGSDFWGIDEDAASLTRFISRWIARNQRWNSPKYLIGESYGTTRSAVLVNMLQGRAGMDFNGVVLISAVLDFETLLFAPGHDVSYITYLPSYAVTAQYHGVIPQPADLEAFLAEVREFALGEYAHALARGAALPEGERAAVIERLAAYTGLSEEYLDRADLRVDAGEFRAELQRAEGKVTSRLDSRYVGYMADLLSQSAPYDPQSTAISGAYTAAVNAYLRDELGYATEDRYVTGGGVRWNWDRGGRGWNAATYVASDLAEAMIANPHLMVEVENGYYDLATPFFAMEYTTDHMDLPDELRPNIVHKYYEAGHMMYVIDEQLAELKANVAEFIGMSSAPTAPTASR